MVNGKPFAPIEVEDFHIYKNSYELCKYINKLNYLIIVVTNQPDIANKKNTLNNITLMHDELKRKIPCIKKIYLCPHNNEDKCNCRKPKTGLFLEAKNEFNIDLSESYLIGDRNSDIEAGQLLGLKKIFFLNRGYKEKLPAKPYIEIKSLLDIYNYL